ncbi:MAG: sarcosine oxidase, subunit alpha [Actinomycetota bacterium]|jgi:sarcosine oxidase subunit alpha|nr:sarcosine oxidase, subunit alpha [Actinomycetota bacterium]
MDVGGSGVDRDSSLGFTFDGTDYLGLAGDTLASALLANGVDVVGASPILGRPRGVVSAGVEEAGAMVEVGAPWLDPIVPATAVELVDGLVAMGRPGVGVLPADATGAQAADHRHLHVETLVVGGGIAGLRAAREATGRVLVVDERHHVGGISPWSTEIEDLTAELVTRDETALITRATALGVYDDGYVVIYERAQPVARVHHVRAARVVLATGAHERPIAFADNDRPGVMLASAARTYVEWFGVRPGNRAVVFSNGRSGLESAMALHEAGVEIAVVLDVGPASQPHRDRLREAGVEVREGWAVAGTEGESRLSAVHVAGPGGESETFDADLLLVAGGWNPAVQLWRGINGGLRYDDATACFVPDGAGPPWLEITGAAAGEGIDPVTPYWYAPAEDLSHHYVDLQRDSTVADVLAATDRRLRSTEHVKRETYIGTAIDQGRTSGVLTAAIVNGAQGAGPGAQGPTNARPPYTPVPFSVLAGLDRGPKLLDPIRTTPIHRWHQERDAPFENVGQWKRPWYFPLGNEDLPAAVHRECLAVRNEVGVMDASTLGKIEIVGPDAARFLDRVYTDRMSTLSVGSIRYGLMLGLDGMVFDDGVVMRLAENRFLATTTTGGAARVLDHMEEWLQTEWPDLRAHCTSVTEQWSTIAMNGPASRRVLEALGTSFPVDAPSFPFMTWREGEVAGIAARVARVSFSGELAYEINVPGWYGVSTWEALMDAGAAHGITPYGTESMHVLRAEKGFVIVGQDTDGTVTPHDLGMSWLVRKDDSDFIGKRSLRRSDTIRPDRKQLVGLLPVEPDQLLPEGAQLVERDTGVIPMAMVGHVTSSYASPILGRTIALAMVESGRARHGQMLHAPLLGATIAAEVTAPIFYDAEGARRDG